jgi:hypothetical protein
MARVRKAELEEMKIKLRTHLDQVEAWFDKEITKLDTTWMSRKL